MDIYFRTYGRNILLFREKARVLIAGDALSIVKQESIVFVTTQSEKISGPPKYFTTDWRAAENSVKLLRFKAVITDLRPWTAHERRRTDKKFIDAGKLF